MVYPKKLTLDQELEIFGRVLHGEMHIDLARQYNVCPATIGRTINRYKNSANHDSARAAAALYYKEKLPTQNRVTHPARPLSESSRHTMPALAQRVALPPAAPGNGFYYAHGAIGMVIHSQTAFAAPVIADWQKGPDCIHEPDSTGQGQPPRRLGADSAACTNHVCADHPPDAAGPGQPAIILGAEPIPTHGTGADEIQGAFETASSTAQSEFEPEHRGVDAPSSSHSRMLELDDSLRLRVLHRTDGDGDQIVSKLLRCGIFSLESCLALEHMEGLAKHGFDDEEVKVLLLEDDSWKSRYAWLDAFIESLPPYLKNERRTTEPLKEAIRQEKGIEGLNDLYSKFDTIERLPLLVKAYIRSQHHDVVKFKTQCELDTTRKLPASRNLPDQTGMTGISASIPCQDGASISSDAERPASHDCANQTVMQGTPESIAYQDGASISFDTERPALGDADLLLCLRNEQPRIEDLCALARIIFTSVPSFYTNTHGISGTIQPGQLMKLLIRGFRALKQAHLNVTDFDFIDIGCSCGHVLWAAVVSKLFKTVYGVDHPENKQAILQAKQYFQNMAGSNPSLATYKEQFGNVQFRWCDCGQLNSKDLGSLLGGTAGLPAMLYWFCTGWSAQDVHNCARMISQSPRVLGVVCLPRGQGVDAEHLLCLMNSSKNQKRFYIHTKTDQVCMSGGCSSHTAYTFVRRSDFEYNLKTPQDPACELEVEVIFKLLAGGLEWFHGKVTQVQRRKNQFSISFDDGDKGCYEFGDPEVVFLPTEDNQWRSIPSEDSGQVLVDQRLRVFCTLCSAVLGNQESCVCARCRITAYHAECLGVDRASSEFLCPFCRSELADLGRRQFPPSRSTEIISAKETRICFGCGSPITKVKNKMEADECRSCKAIFGRCCTSRTSNIPLPFTCPACIGILAHDVALGYCFQINSDRVRSIVGPENCGDRSCKKDALFLDEFGLAIASLQDTCQWELLQKNLPVAMQQLSFQVESGKDPSLGPFHLLNLWGMEGGPDYELVEKALRLFAQHAEKKARKELVLLRSSAKKRSPPRIVAQKESPSTGIKMGYVTADLRHTPWWQLKKAALLALASKHTLFLFSRPPVQLDGDPHYLALKGLCTIIEFEEHASDATVAECIRTYKLDVLMDAGGPTFGCFTGVMALLPDILRGAHLGYPGTQPGGHIDFTVVDQHVVIPGEIQAEKADEALMYLGCYQPNDSFRTSVEICQVPETTRSDWNLPDNKFVFAFFCRLGRISQPLIEAFAEILTATPNTVLWIRDTPSPAVMRVKRRFLIKGIAEGRLILASDVPNEEHKERLRHADLGLDSNIYCGHTTSSDFLLRGVPYLALMGGWWQARVSTSLVNNMMGDIASEFVCCSLKDFRTRAIYFATVGVEDLKRHRAQIRSKVDSGLGICDGESWVSDYERGILEFVRQKQTAAPGTRLPDVFLCKVVNETTTERCRKVLCEQGNVVGNGMHLDHAATCASATSGVDAEEQTSKRQSDPSGATSEAKRLKTVHQAVTLTSNDSPVQKGVNNAVSQSGAVRRTKAESHRLRWLFELTKTDPEQARLEAYKFLMEDMPAGREIAQYPKEDGSLMYAIQLPCEIPRVSAKSGKAKGLSTEVPLLYVSKAVPGRGSDLFCGQEFESGMFMTGYDGVLMHKSQLGEGDSIAHNISLTYSLGLYIDSSRTKDCELVRQSSLGSKINHDYRSSNVRFGRFDWFGPISNFTASCWVVAKDSGPKHAMLKAYYTGSAAERDHGIPRRIVAEGENLIPPDARQGVQPLVTDAMEVLRKDLGLNLVSICGAGSEGVAVEVGRHDVQETFVVKLTSQPVHALKRGGVLCEAALLYQATRKQGCQGIGIFCPTLEKDIGWGNCPVALLRANGQLIGALAMQHFDVDGSFIRKNLSERFMVGHESQNAAALLRDMQSVLRGTMQATVWMHASGLAHGDLKDSNMLLKRLKQIPRDPRVAFCVVEGITYQIVFGDWGHARWSGQSDTAIHVFTRGGKEHETTTLLDVHPKESFTLVKARELSKSYGHMLQTPFSFVHPGSGTVSSRCPNHDREFQHGQGAVQRLFDQAADMWALGVFSVRVLAPPFRRAHDNCGQEWAEGLWKASERAEKQLKALKPSSGGKRASEALHALSVPEDRRSWIAAMVHVLYLKDRWPILSGCLSGDCGSQWLSLLDLQQGLLRFTSEDRLKANDALEHMFFCLDL